MQPLDREKVHFRVAKEIEQYIVANQLKKGDALPSEKQIGQELRIGRSSVREGLRLLEGMGMVQVKPGRGVFVVDSRETTVALRISVDRESLLDVLDIRETLELKACELAMQNATAQDMEAMCSALERLRHKCESGGPFESEDMDFHVAIYKAAHNGYLLKLLEGIVYIFFKAWKQPFGKDRAFIDTFPWHEALCQAIVNRDGRAMTENVTSIIAHSRALLAAEDFLEVPD